MYMEKCAHCTTSTHYAYPVPVAYVLVFLGPPRRVCISAKIRIPANRDSRCVFDHTSKIRIIVHFFSHLFRSFTPKVYDYCKPAVQKCTIKAPMTAGWGPPVGSTTQDAPFVCTQINLSNRIK